MDDAGSTDDPPDLSNHDACWRGGDFATRDDACWDLSPAALSALTASAERMRAEGLTREQAETRRDLIDPVAAALADLSDSMRHGRGFWIVRGFPVDDRPLAAVEDIVWLFGLAFGRPVSQSVMGDRLGHIVDTSAGDPGARAYRNNSELRPHSDPADYLAFLCIRPAMEGGVSRFTSSYAVYDHLRTHAPHHLVPLFRGFHFHRYGEEGPNDAPITPHRVPTVSVRDGVVSIRHLRQYVEMAAEEDPACALSDADVAAIDAFENLANDPAFAFDFTLQPGECAFANNYTTLHARTGFRDWPDDARKRLLLRLWVQALPERPLVPEIFIYEGGPGIPPQPGRRPSHPGGAKRRALQ